MAESDTTYAGDGTAQFLKNNGKERNEGRRMDSKLTIAPYAFRKPPMLRLTSDGQAGCPRICGGLCGVDCVHSGPGSSSRYERDKQN